MKRIFLTFLILASLGHFYAYCQETLSPPPPAPASAIVAPAPVPEAAEDQTDKQLKLNRDALFEGAKEQMRLDAAMVLLVSPDKQARAILLEAITQKDNPQAAAAVCKSLIEMRTAKDKIADRKDFLEPLLTIIRNEKGDTAALCAEATLIFDYEEIGKALDSIIKDQTAPTEIRLNALVAAKLHPDMRVIFSLIGLLNDNDPKVAAEAQSILKSIGIDVSGKDAASRNQIIKDIKRKGADEFLRDWLLRQDSQIRQLREEKSSWQKRYLSSLDKLYDNLDTDADRGKFLAVNLEDKEPAVRQWAIVKSYQTWVGTGIDKTKLIEEIGSAIVKLINDPDRDVRFAVANLLSVMGSVDSAEKLLAQIKIESDDDVRTAQFVALGAACHYALSPNSGIKLNENIKLESLDLAVAYLNDKTAVKSQKGADVMCRLLESDGLSADQIAHYLGLLVQRYQVPETAQDAQLRAGLLKDMAGLCAQSVYKTQAAASFKTLFEKAIHEENTLIRETAVDGLIYIDKTAALSLLRKDFTNDSSPQIRQKLITLARQAGGAEDIGWLSEKLTDPISGEPAWDALFEIFKLSDVGTFITWMPNLNKTSGAQPVLSDEQKIAFLKLAEGKSKDANSIAYLGQVQENLAELYVKTASYDLATEYYGLAASRLENGPAKDAVLAKLLNCYLLKGSISPAKDILEFYLQSSDIAADNAMIVVLNDFITKQTDSAQTKEAVKTLSQIKTPQPRPDWQTQMTKWLTLVPLETTTKPAPAKDPNDPNQPKS